MMDANYLFDDVLAIQEAQRCFNLTQDQIKRMENAGQMERNADGSDVELLTFDELWRIFECERL